MPTDSVVFIHNSLFIAPLSLNACSINQWPTCPNLHPHLIYVQHEGSWSLFEWALHRTGQEISKRNFIKPPQIRGSQKMGPLKTRLSLKESITLMLDIREGMRERQKSDTQVITGKTVNYTVPSFPVTVLHKVTNAANFWINQSNNDNLQF